MIALPRYLPAEVLRRRMRPLIKEEDSASFECSHFIEEYWLKWKKGALMSPGFTPYGLQEHERVLMDHLIEYVMLTRDKALKALSTNIRYFSASTGVTANCLGLPPDMSRLFRDTDSGLSSLFGMRLVHPGHFEQGVLFSVPIYGRYMTFPEREEHGNEEETEEGATQAGGEVSARTK